MEEENEYTDSTVLSFGEYRGWELSKVPKHYLSGVYTSRNTFPHKSLIKYIEENVDEVRDKIAKNGLKFEKHKPEPLVTFLCEKETFANKKIANQRLRDIRLRNYDNHKIPVRSYECPKCSGWHLTSQTLNEWKLKLLVKNFVALQILKIKKWEWVLK